MPENQMLEQTQDKSESSPIEGDLSKSKPKLGYGIQVEKVEYGMKIQKIGNKIYSADNLDSILIDLREEITAFFKSERITIYIVDGVRKELVSRVKTGEEISEIRIPISNESIAGYSVKKQRLLNIKDAYDSEELKKFDPELKFDKSWDKKTGFKTRQILSIPIIFDKHLLGALELLNRNDKKPYSTADEWAAGELAWIIAIALQNQKKIVIKSKTTESHMPFNYLVRRHLLSERDLDQAVFDARRSNENIESYLINVLRIPADEVRASLSNYYKVPSASFSPGLAVAPDLLADLDTEKLKQDFWVPLRKEEGIIVIATNNPYNTRIFEEIEAHFQKTPTKFMVTLKQDVIDFIDYLIKKKSRKETPHTIDEIIGLLDHEPNEKGQPDEKMMAVEMLVNKLIVDANGSGATDIHIEPYPGKQNTMVRIRVNGTCSLYRAIPYNYRRDLVDRIKSMAGMDSKNIRQPQHGMIDFNEFAQKDIKLKVSCIPVRGHVESISMHFMASDSIPPLDELLITGDNYSKLMAAIARYSGLIMVTGPKCCGKTTTIHSLLRYLNRTGVKIWTAEEPVEISQRGLSQVEVRHERGFDYKDALPSILMADPDIIMIGDLSGKTTFDIAVDAALKGHLVIAGYEAAGAMDALVRMIGASIDSFSLSHSLSCVLSQQLGRRLCKICRTGHVPQREEYDLLVNFFGRERFEKEVNIPWSEQISFNRPTGCKECGETGYDRLMAFHEILSVSPDLKRLICKKATIEELTELALAEGMLSIRQNGILKIFEGYTDFVEVQRVCSH